jgi:hypothetical protein
MDVISDFVAGTDHLSFDAGNFGGLNTLTRCPSPSTPMP